MLCLHLHHHNRNGYAKVAQLVERDLAKVEVAGSNPVFRSEVKAPETVLFFSICHLNFMANAGVVELVDTQDLKSCALNRRAGSIPALSTLKSKKKPVLTDWLFC